MAEISNSQSFYAGASGSLNFTYLHNVFKRNMDAVLVGGRNIQVHLPPDKMPCTDVDCKYNSVYKKYLSTTGQVCQTCRGQGFIVEPRFTYYIANIRWTNEPLADRDLQEQNVIGRQEANFVRTKTVESSYDHIRQSEGATIDGLNVELFRQPRYVGFAGQLDYVVTWWKAVNH